MTTLGIDAGATNIRFGLLVGEMLEQTATEKSHRSSPEALAEQCRDIEKKFPDVKKIGIAVPGPLDREGVLHNPPNFPDWGVVNFKKIVHDHFEHPFTLERDSVAALIGEWKMGTARGARNFVLLTIGTGIGGAAVVDGNILRGAHGFSGEFGHALLGPSGRKCGLGHDGCAEAWASGRAMENGVSVEQATDVFARLLRSLEKVFDPECIVLSGGISGFDAYLKQAIHKANQIGLQTDVKVAEFGEWAGVVGAALLTKEKYD
jgi:glucokinase